MAGGSVISYIRTAIIGSLIALCFATAAHAVTIKYEFTGTLKLTYGTEDSGYGGSEIDGAKITYTMLFDSEIPSVPDGQSYYFNSLIRSSISLSGTLAGLRDGTFDRAYPETTWDAKVRINTGSREYWDNFRVINGVVYINHTTEELRIRLDPIRLNKIFIEFEDGLPVLPVFLDEDLYPGTGDVNNYVQYLTNYPHGEDSTEYLYDILDFKVTAQIVDPVPHHPQPSF